MICVSLSSAHLNTSAIKHSLQLSMEKKSSRGDASSWNYLPIRLDPTHYLDTFRRQILPHTFPTWDPDLVEDSPMSLGQQL